MIGCYDFCGHYEWTFSWLERNGGDALVTDYWRDAIAFDSQTHADELISSKGFKGMLEYWGHTLEEESPEKGYTIIDGGSFVRFDMHHCPSKGFLIDNALEQYRDYCDHCIGWIAPVLEKSGFQTDHQHNHKGQCWWEIRRSDDTSPPSPVGSDQISADARTEAGWDDGVSPIDSFLRNRSEKLE